MAKVKEVELLEHQTLLETADGKQLIASNDTQIAAFEKFDFKIKKGRGYSFNKPLEVEEEIVEE